MLRIGRDKSAFDGTIHEKNKIPNTQLLLVVRTISRVILYACGAVSGFSYAVYFSPNDLVWQWHIVNMVLYFIVGLGTYIAEESVRCQE